MESKYTVQYYIDKFSKIPENKWTTNAFGEGNARCANGHCGISIKNANQHDATDEAKQLANLLLLVVDKSAYNKYRQPIFVATAFINDGDDPKYKQRHPKDRILAALEDVKKLQSTSQTSVPEVKVIEKIRYCTISETLKTPIPETQLN